MNKCILIYLSLYWGIINPFTCASGADAKTPYTLHEHGLLQLIDNGYENLVVTISDTVTQDHCNQIIHGLKSVLREFSAALWVATSRRASLREVTVVLPESWSLNALTCSLMQTVETISPSTTPHISITSSHKIFGSRPWAQQSQGCGKPGDFIQMGSDKLRSGSNETYALMARLLLAEWAKFRWGAFEETGHGGDMLYPSFYRNQDAQSWEPTVCTDANVQAEGRECDPSLPNCRFIPDLYTNNHLSSSLLSLPELPSVRKFCDSTNHNRYAPTKHNALCGGRSVWEVIENSPDFSNGRNQASNSTRGLEPNIKFAKIGKPQYVFVVEDTSVMNLQKRWEFLRKAFKRVILYDIMDESRIAVVAFNSRARTEKELTSVGIRNVDTRQRIGSSLRRNPSSVPESHKCILCGIQEAVKVISQDAIPHIGATLILLTSGPGTSTEEQVDEMVRLIDTYKFTVKLILYPLADRHRSSTSPSHGLDRLIQTNSGGKSFAVLDEGVGNDSKISMLVSLMDAFLSSISLSTLANTPGSQVLVHSMSYPGGISSESAGTFALDESLGSEAKFSIYYYDQNHVGNKIAIQSPTGTQVDLFEEEDQDVNQIFFKLERAERGLWSYVVDNRADSHQGLYVQVTARRNTTGGLQTSIWISSGSSPINASNPADPVIIYARVTDSSAPVLNARVKATLQRLGSNSTGFMYEPIHVDLWDNGVGDPDITKGDGVYSRYLPPLHSFPGRYLLTADISYNTGTTLVAKTLLSRHHKTPSHMPHYYHQSLSPYDLRDGESTCCGSSIPHTHTKRSPAFHRRLTWGVLELVDPPPHYDNTPPSRILDLKVVVNDTIHEVTLRWTAPGDDYDYGRAMRYEAVVAPTWEKARAFQGNKLFPLPEPSTAGKLQVTKLNFKRFEELCYVTIRAVDESGNKGGIGNIASLWVPRPPTTYEITTHTQDGLVTTGNYTTTTWELGSSNPVGMQAMQLEEFAVIIGSILGFLLIVLVISSYCYCYTRKKSKHHDKKDLEKRGSDSIVIKSGSCQGLDDFENNRGSMENGIKDIDADITNQSLQHPPGTRSLSPVQSWGATTLLQEHERRLSVNSAGGQGLGDDYLVVYQPEPTPFPDVTVTDHRTCTGMVPTPTSSSNTYSTDPPPYIPPDDDKQCPFIQGTEQQGYNGWDEPLTGHLLTRARIPVPAPQLPPSAINHLDRKRRNVTQV